eukprot:6890843-Prymnesium_polylepis.1
MEEVIQLAENLHRRLTAESELRKSLLEAKEEPPAEDGTIVRARPRHALAPRARAPSTLRTGAAHTLVLTHRDARAAADVRALQWAEEHEQAREPPVA